MTTTADRLDEPAASRHRKLVREVGLLVGLYVLYSGTRLAAGGSWAAARHHASVLLDMEKAIGLDVEHGLNAAVSQITWLAVGSSYWYGSLHYLVTGTVLVLLYLRRPLIYPAARTALMGATLLALFGYVFYPTAPPRLTPGYIDTVSESAGYGWWPTTAEQAANGASTVTNQIAAMPSMHVGWALWVSIMLAVLARRRWVKVLAFGYVTITTLVVVWTANHWILDAVAGIALVLGAWLVSARVYGLRRRAAVPAAVPSPVLPLDDRPLALATPAELPEQDADRPRG